jgi:ATP-binding cassette subfamily A (ABC1) protein 3
LWYAIQVSTSAARGKGKDLLFCIRKAYWRPPPPDEVVEKAPLVDHDEWFENDKDSDAPVQVRGLRKVFGKKVAVSDATFAIRDSEIFCLLGHNGAGKTTTMSMMTGAMAPDGGSANFFGIRTLGPLAEADGLDRLRQLLGFCPQHDALFPQLTLREHLIFYSRLKGVEEARAENEATGLLELFRLTEMAEGFPLKLSGGQKRKVMMAAALTGGSRLVVLDEPTAGMDPVARREVWTLLRDVRVDRSVLLTTHHMEEAEALADRVAIMAAGSVTCCGTLSFLKRHFGGGDDAEVAARRKAAEEEARRKEAEAKALAERMAAAGAEERERLAAEKARLEREAAEARAKAEGGADTSTGGLHVAVTTAATARDQLKGIFAQHVPGAKLAAASKLEEDLRRATETDAANPLLGSTPKSFSSSFKSPLLNATRGTSFSASRNWADGAEAPLLEDSARDVTTTYTVHAPRARVAALFEGLEAEADGLGLVDVSVTATSLEDVFIAVGEQVEGAAAPVEAETLVGGALLPSAPGEPVPAGRLVAAVVQFRLPAVQIDQSDLDSPLAFHTGSSK